MDNRHGSTRPERKTIEKNRRMHMKSLFSELDSLLPPSSHAQQGMSVPQQDRLDEAIGYIKGLQERIERMNRRKRQLIRISSMEGGPGFCRLSSSLPKVEVQDLVTGGIKIVVMSSAGDQIVFYSVVEALEEEGIQIVGANYAVMGDEALHIIHASSVVAGVRRLAAHELMEILVNKANHPSE